MSITPLLSKIFEHDISGRLSHYLEHVHLIPANQFAYHKNLGTTDALLSISHKIQQALNRGNETKVVQLDFSAAFDRVNHASSQEAAIIWCRWPGIVYLDAIFDRLHLPCVF